MDDIDNSYHLLNSVHNLYNQLNNNTQNIEDLDNNVDHIFYCCSCYKTILSYSFTQNINMSLIKLLLDNGANIQLQFPDSYNPLYYLFMYQKLNIIKSVINYKNIKIEKIFHLLDLCVSQNDLSKTYFIINNRYSILFSSELNTIITKYNKTKWYPFLGNHLFMLLQKANISKYNNIFSKLSNDEITHIYYSIFT